MSMRCLTTGGGAMCFVIFKASQIEWSEEQPGEEGAVEVLISFKRASKREKERHESGG